MIIRRTFRGTVVFQHDTGSTNAEAEQVSTVLDFPFELFPKVWEWDGTNLSKIDPVKGFYEQIESTEEQVEWLQLLEESHNEVKEVEGVVGEEW